MGTRNRDLLEKIAEIRAHMGTDPTLSDLATAAARPSADVDREVQLLAAQGLVEGIQMIGTSGFTAIRLTAAGARVLSNRSAEDEHAISIRVMGNGNQVAVAQKSTGTYQSARQGGTMGVLTKVAGWVLAHKVATGVVLVIVCGSTYVVFRYG